MHGLISSTADNSDASYIPTVLKLSFTFTYFILLIISALYGQRDERLCATRFARLVAE